MAELTLLTLLTRSRELGFIGPGDLRGHIENAEAWLDVIPPDAAVLDLGSGGGLPGLVIAERRPDVSLTLLDSQRKRCTFLEGALTGLGRADVDVWCGRAEVLAHDLFRRGHFLVVCARSFGSPAVTAECGVGFLAPGGSIWVSEPPGETNPARWPEAGLRPLGLSLGQRRNLGVTHLQQLVLDGECPDRLPRSDGRPSKRPLF